MQHVIARFRVELNLSFHPLAADNPRCHESGLFLKKEDIVMLDSESVFCTKVHCSSYFVGGRAVLLELPSLPYRETCTVCHTVTLSLYSLPSLKSR